MGNPLLRKKRLSISGVARERAPASKVLDRARTPDRNLRGPGGSKLEAVRSGFVRVALPAIAVCGVASVRPHEQLAICRNTKRMAARKHIRTAASGWLDLRAFVLGNAHAPRRRKTCLSARQSGAARPSVGNFCGVSKYLRSFL